jgi:hypothetical protein
MLEIFLSELESLDEDQKLGEVGRGITRVLVRWRIQLRTGGITTEIRKYLDSESSNYIGLKS